MSDRFFSPPLGNRPSVELTGAEAHHLMHVLRKNPGDQVTLFDGTGTEATAMIVTTNRTSVELSVLETTSATNETRFCVELATAVPKGERFRWLVEKATELGIHRLSPLLTTRGIVQPQRGKLEKMRQTVISACKQSGRSQLMELAPVTRWENFIANVSEGAEFFLADPRGESARQAAGERVHDRPTLLVLGPEGGLTDREIELAIKVGARLVSLGPRTLRVETAALAMAALFVPHCRGG
jgi:16S rRNA (uracil1498-N3)-methyltransferase